MDPSHLGVVGRLLEGWSRARLCLGVGGFCKLVCFPRGGRPMTTHTFTCVLSDLICDHDQQLRENVSSPPLGQCLLQFVMYHLALRPCASVACFSCVDSLHLNRFAWPHFNSALSFPLVISSLVPQIV